MMKQTSGNFLLSSSIEDKAKYLELYIKMMTDTPYLVSTGTDCKYTEVAVYDIQDMSEEEQTALIDKINGFYGTDFVLSCNECKKAKRCKFNYGIACEDYTE